MDKMETLGNFLLILDAYLTGKSIDQCLPMIRQLNEPEKFLSGAEYYLSDGGYSRLYISVADHTVYLTSNSLDKVRENWESPVAQGMVKVLLRIFRKLQDELEV